MSKSKRGRPPEGELYETLCCCVRGPQRREIEAAAKLEGVYVSSWLRWASRLVFERGFRMKGRVGK